MAKTLAEMAAKGRAKLERALPKMKKNYDASKSRAIKNYKALPFGPITKRAYESGMEDAVIKLPDLDKWETNWKAGVQR